VSKDKNYNIKLSSRHKKQNPNV